MGYFAAFCCNVIYQKFPPSKRDRSLKERYWCVDGQSERIGVKWGFSTRVCRGMSVQAYAFTSEIFWIQVVNHTRRMKQNIGFANAASSIGANGDSPLFGPKTHREPLKESSTQMHIWVPPIIHHYRRLSLRQGTLNGHCQSQNTFYQVIEISSRVILNLMRFATSIIIISIDLDDIIFNFKVN